MKYSYVPLGGLVTISGGGTPSRNNEAYWGGSIPWATVKDLKDTTLSGTQETITPEGLRDSASNLIPAGSVIVATRMGLGKVAINTMDVTINQDLKAFSCGDDLEPRYLLYFLLANASHLDSMGKGATVKGITLDVLKDLSVPLPPLPEQKRIAAILDKADSIRRKRQEAVRMTVKLLRSVFLDMFGDPVTNPKGWDVTKFESIGSLDRGVSKHRPRNAPQLLGGPYPLIQTGEVANSDGYIRSYKNTYSEIGLKQSKMWPASTLCITIAANIAKTGILTFDACFPDSVVGFTPNSHATTEYVQYWLSFLQKILEDTAPESAQKNINLEILRNLEIPLPPIEMQSKFSERVKRLHEMKAKQSAGSEHVENLFNSLLQCAFKGHL